MFNSCNGTIWLLVGYDLYRSRHETIIDEVQEKIRRLKIPKGFSIRPFLVHVNGVSDSVIESEFFSDLIDFSQLLIS